MKLAIVGSVADHTFHGDGVIGPDQAFCMAAADTIRAVIRRKRPECIVTGGADGVDYMAETIAKHEFDLPVIVCYPGRSSWAHYKVRNQYIADICDQLVRISKADSKTYGSGWTRDRAAEQGKPTEEYVI